jgi:hypothetical protein
MQNRRRDSKAIGRQGEPTAKGFYPLFDERFLKEGLLNVEA